MNDDDVQADATREEQDEQIKQNLEARFLQPSCTLRPHWLADWQIQWPYQPDAQGLYFSEPARPTTTLELHTVGLEGRIRGYRETTKTASAYLSAGSSTSIAREPTLYDTKSFVRGKSGQFPFAPGGLDGTAVKEEAGNAEQALEEIVKGVEKSNMLGRGGIKTIPPGFERGLDFDSLQSEDDLLSSEERPNVTPVYRPLASNSVQNGIAAREADSKGIDADIEELLPSNRLQMASAATAARKRPTIAKRDWAHVVDVNNELANFRELVPDMAKEYPFELDTFQKEAVYHMELGDSVFIAAHTSAGKTVVAEYAIALAARHMTRAIYTSPIKALSNQKYRDFKQTFGAENVGILTGDVQINPEASCLIMTTEILRSMLYKGADLIRDVEWVIFDEVHYVNDLERGVVWEEVIIMLPDHVGIVLLSATVPNTKEFADWVGRTKKKDIYVISTLKRPVPLEHHLYAGKEIHKIVDSKGEFLGQGWKDAGEALKRKQDKEREAAGLGPLARQGAAAARGQQQQQRGGSGGRGGQGQRGGPQAGRGGGRGTPALANAAVRGAGTFGPVRGGARTSASQDRQLWVHLIGELRKRELLPVVVFSFSKKKCEDHADSMPNTDLCTASEKSEIHIVIERSITRLKGTDKKLPQIIKMRHLLARGIGVHHGGLLPIVKEMVELLFSRGLVKVLFATETFAMGVNMPARTVVFSGTRKHDGRTFRDLLAGEYTQMSGRAGRRGLDETGVVIIVCNDGEPPDTASLQTMILGQPTKLTSQFRLTYTMILNLLRVEALRVEEMIKRSFSENASQRLLPDQQKKVLESEKELLALPKLAESEVAQDVRKYYDITQRLVQINEYLLSSLFRSSAGNKIFLPGRVVIVSDSVYETAPAVILRNAPSLAAEDGTISQERAFWMLLYVPERASQTAQPGPRSTPPHWPPPLDAYPLDGLKYDLRVVPLSSIALVTTLTQKLDFSRIVDKISKSAMTEGLSGAQGLVRQLASDPLEFEADWNKIRSLEFVELLQERSSLLHKRASLACKLDADFEEQYRAVHGYRILEDKVASLKQAISEQNLELLPDYEQRISVLKELQYIDENSTVLLKGRVACEINTGHELVLTELILENFLSGYEPHEVVALLASFVFQERRSETEPVLTDRLKEGKDRITALADRVTAVQVAQRANVAEEGAESNNLNFGLSEVVYEWARGMPFDEITQLTDVQEGTIVRTITRLDETCREVRDAARVIGDAALYQKMEACQACIKRDIVFCASLYL